jgi:hypothetical protein
MKFYTMAGLLLLASCLKNEPAVERKDNDNDGVRDDIESLIEKELKTSLEKDSAMNYAKIAQQLLDDAHDKEKTISNTYKQFRLINCMVLRSGMDKAFKLQTQIDEKILDSENAVRLDALTNSHFNGQSHVLKDATEEDCKFEN